MVTHIVTYNLYSQRNIATVTVYMDDCLKQAVNKTAEHARQIIDSTGRDSQERLIISDADHLDLYRIMFKSIMDSIILFKAYTTGIQDVPENPELNNNGGVGGGTTTTEKGAVLPKIKAFNVSDALKRATINFFLPKRLKHIPTWGQDPTELPEQSFNETLLFQIDNSIDDYLVNSILAAWYKTKNVPDLYNLYIQEVQGNRDSIKNLLNERTKPVVLRHRNL